MVDETRMRAIRSVYRLSFAELELKFGLTVFREGGVDLADSRALSQYKGRSGCFVDAEAVHEVALENTCRDDVC